MESDWQKRFGWRLAVVQFAVWNGNNLRPRSEDWQLGSYWGNRVGRQTWEFNWKPKVMTFAAQTSALQPAIVSSLTFSARSFFQNKSRESSSKKGQSMESTESFVVPSLIKSFRDSIRASTFRALLNQNASFGRPPERETTQGLHKIPKLAWNMLQWLGLGGAYRILLALLDHKKSRWTIWFWSGPRKWTGSLSAG